MNKLMNVVLLVGIVALPALAEAAPGQLNGEAARAHASVPASPGVNPGVIAPNAIYTPSGRYKGQDPDLKVRFELNREGPATGE